ncbi:MAG: 3-phosphoserine/phosphohydroxythreonine transaminase [Gammaproteobacteria bacterium]|nr:3-phosphoserine/phosphohydroxythreonine transaminase [Gammaproteobacteria bacterium]
MSRVFNFSAGPAALPDAVMRRAQEEFTDYNSTGMSAMEMSHRSREFLNIAEKAEHDLRELLSISPEYKVLFLQGGATSQFAMVPLNLLRKKTQADYFNTGYWSAKSIKEARRLCEVNVAVDGSVDGFTSIPGKSDWRLNPNAAYVHYTPNETIGGVEFHEIPDVGEVPLVADMSSTILSRPLDITRYAVVYAGAQKNIGPAGLTLVILHEGFVKGVPQGVPSVLDYAAHVTAGSMYNTPPTFAWYMAGLVFQWLLEQGGVQELADRNRRKAEKLYSVIDGSGFYNNKIDPGCRSWMNIPFQLTDEALDSEFLAQAKAAGLLNLKGHRSVGGMRASIYNAMSEEGVDTLISFMEEFERQNG